MDAHRAKARLPSRTLPRGVIHRANRLAPMRENPDWIRATLSLDDRPSHIVQDYDVRALRLERFGRYHEHTAVDLGHVNLPSPFQSAHVALAQTGIHGEECHAGKPCGQLREESVLLLPGDRVGQSWRFRHHRDCWWQSFEPRMTIVVSVGAGGAIENRA